MNSFCMEWLKKRPWLLIVAGFIVLISVWFVFIAIASENIPESVPLSGQTAD